ncbi:hypothetical protein [Bacillus velezensis]|uniref:hypothetical protein n=1 Tax=Bacillus velezensis TaxID=492670 RepID=UPI001E4639E0|nr:hypothetical protein [Bacillus velezensis]
MYCANYFAYVSIVIKLECDRRTDSIDSATVISISSIAHRLLLYFKLRLGQSESLRVIPAR